MSDLRVGIGVDAHGFADGIPLVLGGVEIPFARGLAGHSDGDVIAHALIDAVLGAARLGDIGGMFPSDDPELRGVSSLRLLATAAERVRGVGYELANADCVVIGEEPRVGARRQEMEEALERAGAFAPGTITVRATTTDGLGFTGRREGLAAHAVALLRATQ